jgi:endonuclease VIII
VPEGDTIFRTAATLRLALDGNVVVAVDFPRLVRSGQNLVGSRIVAIVARGKNLLVHFDCGMALHTHMKMTGSWHIYRPGERWQKPASLLRARLDVDDRVAVCFNAPVVRLLTDHELARDPALLGLGPDLLDPAFEEGEALRRIREHPDRSIGEALLDQGLVAGVGNIFKSETLFVARVRPRTPVRELDDATLRHVLAIARRLLVANSGHALPCGSTNAMARRASLAVRRSSRRRTANRRGIRSTARRANPNARARTRPHERADCTDAASELGRVHPRDAR